jgi:hypothetical protein
MMKLEPPCLNLLPRKSALADRQEPVAVDPDIEWHKALAQIRDSGE